MDSDERCLKLICVWITQTRKVDSFEKHMVSRIIMTSLIVWRFMMHVKFSKGAKWDSRLS